MKALIPNEAGLKFRIDSIVFWITKGTKQMVPTRHKTITVEYRTFFLKYSRLSFFRSGTCFMIVPSYKRFCKAMNQANAVRASQANRRPFTHNVDDALFLSKAA